MVMVCHQAVGVNDSAVTLDSGPNIEKEPFPVFAAPKNILLLIPTGRDVVIGARKLNPQCSRHLASPSISFISV
jgi:hypothetical protein